MLEQSERSAWYDQNYAAAQARQKGQKSRRTLKLVMLIVCALILIGAVLYAIFGKPADFYFQVSTPNFSVGDDLPEDFDEFRDYVNKNYTAPETPAQSNLQRGETDADITLTLADTADRETLGLQALYKTCADSIVGIKAMNDGQAAYAWGSGVIMTEDGYIITNQHIVSERDSATVILTDGREFEALLIGEDVQTDLAVLKIEAENLPAAEFGDSDALCVGDEVAAIGNPLGETFSGTMTNGIVSAINRHMDSNGRRQSLLQTSAAINEGSSGGALINMYGQVIGITNMKMVSYYSPVAVEGIGFAIPSTTVKSVVEQLIAHGKVTGRPGIGITVGAVDAQTAARYGIPEGLLITAVVKDCDADVKGILVGDVVTHINGQAVYSTDDVFAIRDKLSPGDTIKITIYRDGKTFDVPVVLYDQNDH